MINKINISFNINKDIVEKFEIALLLNKEDADEIITNFMSDYISNSFLKVSKNIKAKTGVRENYTVNNHAKANRRIPLWGERPHQNNHKIIKAFFEIESEFGFVTIDLLESRCSNQTKYPKTYVSDFKGNFAQMRTDASNSHGKVFVIKDGLVTIWDEVEQVLMKNKYLFMKS